MPRTPRQQIAASDLKRRVGQNLALARTSMGWSQARMVKEYKELGVTPPKLSEWESGKYYPDAHFLVALCNDQGFTMDWFFRGVRAGVSVERAAGLRQAEAERSAA